MGAHSVASRPFMSYTTARPGARSAQPAAAAGMRVSCCRAAAAAPQRKPTPKHAQPQLCCESVHAEDGCAGKPGYQCRALRQQARTVKALAGQRVGQRGRVLAVDGDVLHGALVGRVRVVGVVGDLERHGLLAACEQRDLVPRLHELARQVHADEARAACGAGLLERAAGAACLAAGRAAQAVSPHAKARRASLRRCKQA